MALRARDAHSGALAAAGALLRRILQAPASPLGGGAASSVSQAVSQALTSQPLSAASSVADALRARDALTGRAADPGGAAHVSRVMRETYTSLGCATERLPALPLGPRLDLLLAQCGLPPAADSRVPVDSRVPLPTWHVPVGVGADAEAEAEVARVAAAYGVSYL